MKKLTVLLVAAVIVFGCLFSACSLFNTITFDAQNGETPQTFRYDKTFVYPENPQNEDKIFCGWYLDKECTERWYPATKLNKDTTVYAGWATSNNSHADLSEVFEKYNSQNWNFRVNYTVKHVGTSLNSDELLQYDGNKIAWTYKNFLFGNTDYLTVDEESGGGIYYKANGNKHKAYHEGSVEYSENVSAFPYLELSQLPSFDFYAAGESYFAVCPQEVADSVLGKYDNCRWRAFDIFVRDGEITKISAVQTSETNGVLLYTLTFDKYDQVFLTLPIDPAEHTHNFGENYLMFVKCADVGCDVVGRKQSTNQAKKQLVYDFDSTVQTNIENDFDELEKTLAEGRNFFSFARAFNVMDEDMQYIADQYQMAYVFYCAYDAEKYEKAYNTVSTFYNECVSRYYGLFRAIHSSPFKDSFFKDWPEEEVNRALLLSDSYGDSRYVDIKNQIDDLVLRYYDMLNTNYTDSEISALYGNLVSLNNKLANLAGYDNYMDYAYENDYGRDYTPGNVVEMRNYVKQYIAPLYDKMARALNDLGVTSKEEWNLYFALSQESVFKDSTSAQMATEYMGNYLKQMQGSGTKQIDFFEVVNDVFKNGNYYLGNHDGAYTSWMPTKETSVLYFSNATNGNAYLYQNTFTFVHEFGHYYNGFYNGGLETSYDLCETQSQGNEAMFLTWLSNNLPQKYQNVGKCLTYEKLCDFLGTIVISTAVDEFEQASYSGYYNNVAIGNDYNSLFTKILRTYGTQASYNTSYWQYVVFDNAAYYISYAMSALPCVELYVSAMENYDNAKEIYFRLFTYTENENLTETLADGSKQTTASYQEILNYCGLKSPFQSELYLSVKNYFELNLN